VPFRTARWMEKWGRKFYLRGPFNWPRDEYKRQKDNKVYWSEGRIYRTRQYALVVEPEEC